MWWFKALLFFLLSPGILLTIPAGSRGIWMSGQTSVAAAAVHALVFVAVMYILYPYVAMYEGFDSTACPSDKPKRCNGMCVPQKQQCPGEA